LETICYCGEYAAVGILRCAVCASAAAPAGCANFDLLLAVCGAPQMLEAWSYSVFQQQWLVQRLGPVVGAGNVTTYQPTSAVAPRGRNAICERLEEAPLLLPLRYALISPVFRLFPMAALLASARRGWWTENDTVSWLTSLCRLGQRLACGGRWSLLLFKIWAR